MLGPSHIAREPLRKYCAALTLAALLTSGAPSGGAAMPETPAWHQEPGCRWRVLSPATGQTAGFTLMEASATGVSFTNHLSDAASAQNRILENGSGVALGDVDGDGLCDVYLCRLEGPNVLYRNLGGWRFEEITASAGVACDGQYSTGAVLADVDGDGDLDLLVNSIGGGTRLFLNDGKGRFTEMTDSRLAKRFGSTSLALADADNDGDLDLYVCNYRTTTYLDRPPGLKVEARKVGDQIVVTPEDRFIPLVVKGGGVEVMEKGERDFFYVNDGTGHFLPVSWTMGSFVDEAGNALTAPPADWGLSVLFRDLNGDATPDLYICNDFFYSPDRCWLNEDGKRFRAIPALGLRHQSVSSMGADVADLNRDGVFDVFVTDMISRRHDWRQRQRPNMMKDSVRQPIEDPLFRPESAQNTLHLGLGSGRFAEIAYLSGIDATEWSWGAVFLDADLDGYEDLLVPTGNNHDVQDADVIQAHSRRAPPATLQERIRDWNDFPRLRTPMLAFRNQHDLTFRENTADWGLGTPGPFTSVALADLDGDGDLDLVANVLNGPATLFHNNSAHPRVAVRLRGEGANTRGIGALIRVSGGPVEQMQEMVAGSRYLSGDDPMRVFAAGDQRQDLRITVQWRGGKRSVIEHAQSGRLYEIDERQASGSSPRAPQPAPPLFEDQSGLLGHRHQEPPFDDFGMQPLLSKRLSGLGPGVSWLDLDGDGWEDLVVGAGKGGLLGVYRNLQGKGFAGWTNWHGSTPWPRATTTILPRFEAGATRGLLVGVASYEDGRTNASAVLALPQAGAEAVGVVPDLDGSAGPLALADVDGDGSLDLFVGARVRAANYPVAPPSVLYRGLGLRFEPDATNSKALAAAGLVSGACFADLNEDGWPDLALACEWGPVRVYLNRRGTLTEQTNPLGLAGLTGWWTSVAAGDFDNDGRLDLVAGNWGRNTRFQSHLDKPLRAYYGPVDGGVGLALIECYFDAALAKWVPWRDYSTMAMSLPWLADTLPSFRAYAAASIQDVLGTHFSAFSYVEAATLDTTLFLNRGDHFEARPLPTEAQFAPVFGMVAGDLDGNGNLDLVLGQNFFGVEPETTRYDGGFGLVLLGDGRGAFRPLGRLESGLDVPGEQRGCAAADFDHDGRLDLVLTQNRQSTRLLHNRTAKPGLRLNLHGPEGNPRAVGTVVRAGDGSEWGPVQQVQCGSGYWSVNGTPVVTFHRQPTKLWLRWPGGKEQTVDVPSGAKELEVNWSK